jgi:hypothetical protein
LEQICVEEDISRILEWKEDVGISVNLKIALIMARQLAWPVDSVQDGLTRKFVLVVPTH